jgi:hypothetical protein
MPLKPCIKNIDKTYMHLVDRQELLKDINGKTYYRFFIYKCDCGQEHKLDRENNFWVY